MSEENKISMMLPDFWCL